MERSDLRIYNNVIFRGLPELGQWVTIGVPPRGRKDGELPTIIGKDAIIRSHSVIYAGNVIGDRFQTGHGVMVREENEIGNDVSIGTHSVIEHHIKLGHGVRIHSRVFIPEFSIIDAGAWVGPGVVLTNAFYPLGIGVKESLKGPHILAEAKIGANATLLPRIVIGRRALVGAGAVVTRNVPDNKVVVGNPARIVKDISEIKAYTKD